MTYIVSEDTKISGKWIQLILRSMDIMDQLANQSVSQSVCHWHTYWLQPASQSVRLSLTDRLTFINNLFRFRRFKNSARMDSTYITECGYKGSVSQPTSQPASLSICPSQTDSLIYIYIYILLLLLYWSIYIAPKIMLTTLGALHTVGHWQYR